jgi:serine/threonine-protein kinase
VIGSTLGHYRIRKELGSGGMGMVYLGEDTRLHRDVAVKVIGDKHASADARSRLLREARMASSLNHANICVVYDVGEAEGAGYIVMEFVDGESLSRLIPETGLTVDRTCRYATQIVDALVHAHGRRVVHRDLKSSNIVVTSEESVKVLDFGVAKRLVGPGARQAATLTVDTVAPAGSPVGTIHYMSPEVLRGRPADARSDLWSFGVLLFEMATGSLPFTGATTYEVSSEVLHTPTPDLPETYRFLTSVLERCLAKLPDERFQTARELKAALVAARNEPALPPVGVESDSAPIRSLVVLPLADLSDGDREEYFADGMTEAITVGLAKRCRLRVISRTSAMQYKGTHKPLPRIAQELSVDAVVEGSVMRSGSRVRITARLIKASTDEDLWTETYDRELSNVLELQSDVATAIAGEIRTRLAPEDRAELAAAHRSVPRRVDPEAFEWYLKGRHAWGQRTGASLRDGIACFRKALDRDPGYALAYVGMAECYSVLGFQGAMRPKETYVPAMAAARRALELEPELAEAYYSLGYALEHYEADWDGSEAAYSAGLELNPGYATGHHWHSLLFLGLGKRDEAVAAMRRAWEFDPLSLIIQTATGFVHHMAGEVEAAGVEYRKAIDSSPDFWAALSMGSLALAQAGDHEEGLEWASRALELSRTPVVLAVHGTCLALAGRQGEARKALEELDAMCEQHYVRPRDRAMLCAALGDREQALTWLEKAMADHGNWLVYLRTDPSFDSLRGKPRFEALMRAVYGARL